MNRKTKRRLILGALALVVVGTIVFLWSQRPKGPCVSELLNLSAAEVEGMVLSNEYPACDDPHSNDLQWTLVTSGAQIEDIFDLFDDFHMQAEAIDDSAEEPCGGNRRNVICMLQSGSKVEFCFVDEWLMFEDCHYPAQEGQKSIGSQLDALLAGNEFVPYVDLALQGYLPLYISNLADVQLEEIKTILVSKRIDSCAEDGMPLHWAQVTDSMDKQALYLLLHEGELAAPDDAPIEWPAGGGPQYVTYILKDGTSIEMSIYEKHVFGVGDAYYEFRDQLRNELPSRLNDILADYEFAPLE